MAAQVLIRRGALGDTLLIEPIARAMRAERPDLPLHVAGVSEHVAVLKQFDRCDAALSSEAFGHADASRLLVRSTGYARVVCDETVPVSTWCGVRDVRIFHAQLDDETQRPASRVLLDRAGYAHVPDATPRLVEARRPVGLSRELILHPGSGSPKKCWPLARWQQLARRLREIGHAVAFVSGPVERERGVDVRAVAGDARVLETKDVVELAHELASAAVFVGHDSGPTHLAAALCVPTVAIFLSTEARVWAPPDAHVFQGDVRLSELVACIGSLAGETP